MKRRKGTAQERLDAAEEDEARWVDKMLRAATRVRKLRAEIVRLEPLAKKESNEKIAAFHRANDAGLIREKCSGCGAKSFLQERAGEILCDSCYCLNEHQEQNPKCPECKTNKCRFQTGDATVEDLNAESKRIAEVILPKLTKKAEREVVDIGGGLGCEVPKPAKKRRRSKKEADPDKRPW